MNNKGNFVLRQRNKVKIFLVNYKGGKCEKCHYNKCIAALTFHHIDPKMKEFSISEKMYKPLEFLIKEVDKCLLLCKNCHAETHAKSYHFEVMKDDTAVNSITLEKKFGKMRKCLMCKKRTYNKVCSKKCRYEYDSVDRSFKNIESLIHSYKNINVVALKLKMDQSSLRKKIKKENMALYETFFNVNKKTTENNCLNCNKVTNSRKNKKYCSKDCYFTANYPNYKSKKVVIKKNIKFCKKRRYTQLQFMN